MTENKVKKYDLEERTLKLSCSIILLCKKLPSTTISHQIIKQLIASGTSVGANYHEANGASSPKDFKNKIHIALKEAREAKYWLAILANTFTESLPDSKVLETEVQELVLILTTISRRIGHF